MLRLGRWLLPLLALGLLAALIASPAITTRAPDPAAPEMAAPEMAAPEMAAPDVAAPEMAAPPPVAFIREGAVWLAAADGRDAAPLTSAGRALEAALSPDGRQVAYLLAPPEALAAGMAPLPVQVWLADLDSGDARPLLDDPALRSQLGWSPDGRRLALVQGASLQVLTLRASADGGPFDAVADQAVAVAALAADGLAYSGYAWALDGGLVALCVDAAGHQRLTQAGAQGAVDLPLPDELAGGDPPLVAVAPHPAGEMLALLDARGRLWSLALPGGDVAPLLPEAVDVAALAWAPDGQQLAYVDRGGGLWLAAVSTPDSQALGDQALGSQALGNQARTGRPTRLARLAAPALAVAWRDGLLQATLTVRGGAATVTVDPLAGAVASAGLVEALTAQSAPPANPPMLAEVSAPFAWYRYQGAAESGPCASVNCGPTSVAMAIQLARNGLVAPISAVRTYVSGSLCDGTNTAQLRSALTHWNVPYKNIYGMAAVEAALRAGHIVLTPVIMGDIAPGPDYESWNSSASLNYGRYYAYASGHWLVVRGITADRGWVKVYDPNVWESGKYHYDNGAPKGRDRLYPYGEFARALAGNSNWAIEITAAPPPTPTPAPQPTLTPTPPPAAQAPVVPGGLYATQGLHADRVVLWWRPVAGADFYTVHRAPHGSTPQWYLGNPFAPGWTDRQPEFEVPYDYWVTACNLQGCSDYAGPATGWRGQPPPPRAWLPVIIGRLLR